MTVIRIGSVTRAQRAKEVLEREGIRAKVIKLSEQRDGCVHAIEISGAPGAALRMLDAHGIRGTVTGR